MTNFSLFFFLNIIILIFSVIAIINFNPIFAVLSMIVAFLLAVLYFSIMGAYLISMMFLIVYVGAVAMLFVFSLILFERVLTFFNYFFFSITFLLSFFYLVFFTFFNISYFSNVFEFELDFFTVNSTLFESNVNTYFNILSTFSNDYVLQTAIFDFGYSYLFLNGIILFFFTIAIGFIFSGSQGNIKFLQVFLHKCWLSENFLFPFFLFFFGIFIAFILQKVLVMLWFILSIFIS